MDNREEWAWRIMWAMVLILVLAMGIGSSHLLTNTATFVIIFDNQQQVINLYNLAESKSLRQVDITNIVQNTARATLGNYTFWGLEHADEIFKEAGIIQYRYIGSNIEDD